MLSGINTNLALLLLQEGKVSTDLSPTPVHNNQQEVKKLFHAKLEAPASTGISARLETKVVETLMDRGTRGWIDDMIAYKNKYIRKIREDERSDPSITVGNDPEWEKQVGDAEWQMKYLLGELIRHNSPVLAEDALAARRAEIEKNGDVGYPETAEETAKRRAENESNLLERMNREYRAQNRVNFFPIAMEVYGLKEYVHFDDKGAARVKTGDYSMPDGTRYMSIGEDGSLTTYNKDGSIRRKETLTDLMNKPFSHSTASLLSDRLNDEERWQYKMF